MNYNAGKQRNKVKVWNGAEALFAALFSLAASGGLLWLLRGVLYDEWPVYEELVAGGSIWDGYQKQGDMILFYLSYLLLPFFFCLFLYLKHTFGGTRDVAAGVKKAVCEKQNVTHSGTSKRKDCGRVLMAAFLGLESVRALQIAAAAILPGYQTMIGLAAKVLMVLLLTAACGLLVVLKSKKTVGSGMTEWLLRFSQLCIPFQFLGFFRFYYWYETENGLIQLFYSAKWKWFCIGLFVMFLFCQVRSLWKRKNGVYLSTLLMLAAGQVMRTPEGILSVDFFHNGEMAMPMQQLVSYGKLPYFDLDPIHGMCDYFYSLCNMVFFDGSYLSQNAAIQTAAVLMALLLAFVMGKCIENRYLAAFLIVFSMPYLVQKAGVRYLVFFVAFFVLFSEQVRRDSRKFLWWWVLLCIAGISWNVSIGSSMAVAFLPEVLYRMVKDIIPVCKGFAGWTKKEKRAYLTAYGILVLLGIMYIPWFLQILRFLGENAGTTLFVNGTAVFGEEFSLMETFGFVLPYLIVLAYALGGCKKAKPAFVSMFSCLLVISNYACVRYDEGARLAVLAVFFMVLYAGTILPDHKVCTGLKRMAVLLFVVLGIRLLGDDLPDLENPMAIEEITASLELEVMGEKTDDPIVYVTGDSIGMSGMGTGFMRGSTLNSLKNIQTVFDAELEGESYMDLTNRISHYVIFDKESVLPFTSAYNISNEKMQEKAIALVEEKKPHLILISPLIQFDLAPVSLRSLEFYISLIEMGYQPYVYGDVVYLLDGEAALAEAVDGRRSLGLAYHKEYLGMLPYIWGNSLEQSERMTEGKIEQIDGGNVQIVRQDTNCVEVFTDSSPERADIDYIKLVVSKDAVVSQQLRMSFESSVDSQEHAFVFLNGLEKAEEDTITYLIPVGSSPFWQFSEENSFMIEGLREEGIQSIECMALR